MKAAAQITPNNEMQGCIVKKRWIGSICTLYPHTQTDKLQL